MNGQVLELSGQQLNILLCLAQSPGKVIDRDTLKSLLWRNSQHYDVNRRLNTAICALRKSVGLYALIVTRGDAEHDVFSGLPEPETGDPHEGHGH